MLKWINHALGRTLPDIPPNISRSWAEQLFNLLMPIDKLDGARAGLAADMATFVLQGEPITILNEVGQRKCIADHLHLAGYHYGSKLTKTEKSIYTELAQVPVDVVLRWAKLLDAIAGSNNSNQYSYVLPYGVHWPEILMLHSADRSLQGWSSDRPVVKGISFASMESMLTEAGLPASALIESAFSSPVNSGYQAEQRLQMVVDLDGFAAALQRHVEVVRPLLLPPIVAQKLHMLKLLGSAEEATIHALAPELCELAVSSSKQVRAAAEPFVRKCAEKMLAPLKVISSSGKPDQRVNALRLLWTLSRQLNDADLLVYARTIADADKAPNVRALIQEWDSEAIIPAGVQDYQYEIPVIDWSNALTPEVTAALSILWAELNAVIDKANKQSQEQHARNVAQGHKWPLRLLKPLSDSDLKRLRNYIASDDPRLHGKAHEGSGNLSQLEQPLLRFVLNAAVSPVVVLKTLVFFGEDKANRGLGRGIAVVFNAMHHATGKPTLLELQQLLEAVGHTPEEILQSYCSLWGGTLATDWSDEAVWPFFAHNLELLTQYLNPTNTKDYWFDRKGLFRAIATLPSPPERLVNVIFDLALGTAKTERPAAQEALANLPGKELRIINALADGKADVRAIAAQWLGRLGHTPAQAALEQAVNKEKHDVPKGAMLDALQALGQPVEKYLNRQALAAEAEKSLSKGLPKDFEWFPFSALPSVHWEDSGEAVSDGVLRWLLVQAVRQKSPEPNAVLRKYCAMFDPRDREQIGQFVLEAWLREDVRPISQEDAMQRANQHAQSVHSYMQNYPQYYKDDPNYGRTVAELTAAYLPGFLRQPAGSAISCKGVLAVVAACAAERAATPVSRFLKEYYGTRAAQGKALIAMLAWIEHPSATQLMLSVGNRFRTKSFQEEATRQAEALAERKGWTISELADRTIPSGGFDESGTLELSYGLRSFSAKLLPDFKVELFNPDGKKISALPEPRQDDDVDLAKDAKKAYSAAKKEIKNIIELQTDRLYEALCTGRDWSYEDWSRYLNSHPIVRKLVQRLVWVQFEDERVVQVFRPLDDGSLSDADDNEIVLAPAARVRVAHDSLLTADQIAKWQQHLADYAIAPLFQQLGKGTYTLPEDKARAEEIKDFEGHMIEAFALRGRSLKLGYTRGAAEDGGWFHVYEKRFPTLGLLAIIEFTGNPLPEENRNVALLNLSFGSTEDKGWQRGHLALGKVPKVLLSECYNDLRLIAAEGSGFDADWQKKSEY
jgi:hypothetical protein